MTNQSLICKPMTPEQIKALITPDENGFLPCQCGGKPELLVEGTQPEVGCDECGLSRSIQASDYFTQAERYKDPGFAWIDAPHYHYAEKGIERIKTVLAEIWNTRQSTAAIRQLLEVIQRQAEALEATKIFHKERTLEESGWVIAQREIALAEAAPYTKILEKGSAND